MCDVRLTRLPSNSRFILFCQEFDFDRKLQAITAAWKQKTIVSCVVLFPPFC